MITFPLKVLLSVLLAVAAIGGGVAGFLPPYLAGLDSTRSATRQARDATLGTARERVLTSLGYAPRMLDQWDGTRREGGLQANFSTFPTEAYLMYPTVTALMASLRRSMEMDRDGTITTIGLYSQGTGRYVYTSQKVPNSTVLYNSLGNGIRQIVNTTNTSNANTTDTQYTIITPDNYGVERFLVYETNALLNRTAAPFAAQYLPGVYAGRSSIEMVCGLVYADPAHPGTTVFLAAVLNADTLKPILMRLLLAPSHRLAVIDAVSGKVLVVSWDETAEIRLEKYSNQSPKIPPQERMLARTLTNFSDARVRAAAAHIGPLSNVTLPFSNHRGEGDTVDLVDLVAIEDRRYGLNLALFSVLLERELVGDVYGARTVAIAVVCTSIFIVAVCGVLVALCVVRPLDVLAAKMFETARFRGECEDLTAVSNSRLTEVDGLQRAFADMRTQLHRVRSFLPQTLQLLLVSEREEEEEDVHAGGPTDAASHGSAGVIRALSATPSGEADAAHTPTDAGHGEVSHAVEMGERSRHVNGGDDALKAVAVVMSRAVQRGAVVRVVSVLAVNARGWHAVCRRGPETHDRAHAAYVGAVLQAVREQRGVVDQCHGDRLLASFNAVSAVAGHATKAVAAALAVDEAVRAAGPEAGGVTATMGVATGPALAGNMGVTDLMRFMLVGSPVGGAWELERAARVLTDLASPATGAHDGAGLGGYAGAPPVGVCGSGASIAELEHHFVLLHADLAWIKDPNVIFCGSVMDSGPPVAHRALVSLVMASIAPDASDEWMYTLAQHTDKSPFRHVNDVLRRLWGELVASTASTTESRAPPNVISSPPMPDDSDPHCPNAQEESPAGAADPFEHKSALGTIAQQLVAALALCGTGNEERENINAEDRTEVATPGRSPQHVQLQQRDARLARRQGERVRKILALSSKGLDLYGLDLRDGAVVNACGDV